MSKEDKSKAAAANPQEALQKEIELIARGQHSDPFAVLGPHWTEQDGKKSLAIRVFRPNAAEATVLWGKKAEAHRTVRIHPEGVFEAQIPASGAGKSQSEAVAPGAYRLRIRFSDGNVFETYDPYAFPPVLTEYDLYLSGEGTHYQKYEKLGAHVREVAGVRGVHFGVWAPNARRVSVVGDFNFWDGRVHPMRHRGSSGIWEVFHPRVGRRRGLQIRDSIERRELSRLENRPVRLRRRNAAEQRVSGAHALTATSGRTRRGWSRARCATGCTRR